MKNISVFCGAHLGNNPIYAQEAKKMAELMQKKELTLYLVEARSD